MGVRRIEDVKFYINKASKEGLIKDVRIDDANQIIYFSNNLGVNFMVKIHIDQFVLYYERGNKYLLSGYINSLPEFKKQLLRRPLTEEVMINELFSRRKADLDEIVDSEANPSKDEILNSKDFQVNLINDLINKKANVNSWEVRKSSGSMEDLQTTDDNRFPVDFDFDFIYNFHGIPVSLTLFINGEIDVNWKGSHRSPTHWQPAEVPTPEIDNKTFGRGLDLALYDDDGSEISLTWLSPELQTKVVKSIIAPYL